MSIKKLRCLSILESLPHDCVERILERLDVDSLMRLKGVSKQWKSTIESPFFQRRQLTHRQQSGNPDVLMVSLHPDDEDIDHPIVESLSTLVLGSSSSVHIPTPWDMDNIRFFVSHNTCDGLACLYMYRKPGFVVNPTTRWYRPLPLCNLQQLMFDLGDNFFHTFLDLHYVVSNLGFGKDKITGTYKPVWLYNSSEIGLDNATTCEVFDFSTNAWRSVSPAAPCRIVAWPEPVCVDGSLHWFTECEETKILSLDLHTEAFQVVCNAPFANVRASDIVMCDLDNHLCVSEMKWPNQVIWSLNSANKTWHKMCSIDLTTISQWFRVHKCALMPLALFDGKKKKQKKLLFYARELREALLELDLETNTYDILFDNYSIGFPVCYFQSLISIS
ncbi:PREDICTED: F-box/LRR-repeat/kelch-repeat protein At1g09650-like [Camelina sativa]|uniref:F-box/LRR-repeat/kelch-repeat protein At1g09650-like n=1 Tax=Camelina sativa TaxID=90675 RepID=A0ABM1QY74_CAMSA|nr:PREDICTED: F-box/LRR-repeat/kelch-repeat protein At1g09650-like [Camelina sativa]XP_019091710.1 PREDICTED: F-box/LRR-repeat/kelch-repeat protein At1g09650-like [Camelina sativa]XP_019091711.1 PREDICTED: F-box/LRR-repeat/kelch-repeat protein At1g09650-like [Camelina sativa]XP_019091712.1 PREDICTED: F-box/LRR-repeat/kelch-repeat protein At1g09650-like [Camelina sativa]